jgi:hypothetical protein
MADEPASSEETPTPPSKADAATPEEEMSSAEALKKGMGLLWRAAQTAASEIQREVELSGVRDSLQQAGHDLEKAAKEAAKTLEDYVERSAGGMPKPNYTDQWPPGDGSGAKQVDADVPDDGGTDDKGEKRDMRIQLDDD